MTERERAEIRLFYLEERFEALIGKDQEEAMSALLCEKGKLLLEPLGEKDSACQSFVDALRFDPANKEAAQLLEEHFPNSAGSSRPKVVVALEFDFLKRGPDAGPDSASHPSPRLPKPTSPQAGYADKLPEDEN